jgi:hypothetical protein
MIRKIALVLSFAVMATIPGTAAQPAANFSGTWKQSNERCVPKRNGDVTLRIDHQDRRLMVETTILRGSSPARHAVQRYTTDGKVSVSTGADGDEFHTSVSWKGPSLVFAVEEHEDGRILLSTETWTLIKNGAVLQRVRQRSDGNGETQTFVYLR